MASLASIEAAAVIPDQLVSYVDAISGLQSEVCHKFVIHKLNGSAVLAAYPDIQKVWDANAEEKFKKDLNIAVDVALSQSGLKNIAILAPLAPDAAPEHAKKKVDRYWIIDLPPTKPGQKLRNLLKSSGAKLNIRKEGWSEECARVAKEFCERKKLDDATRFLFERLPSYLAGNGEPVLYVARDANEAIQGCAIADYSALSVAFYMFAFGQRTAPPGTADLILGEIAKDATNRGYGVLNLGLGINRGIEFFKKKWGARPYFQLTETEWEIRKPGFFKRVFGIK